jgi:hypothetical protein
MKNEFSLVRPVDGNIVETGFAVHHDSVVNLFERGFPVTEKNKKLRTDLSGYAVNLLFINQINFLFSKVQGGNVSTGCCKKRLTLA